MRIDGVLAIAALHFDASAFEARKCDISGVFDTMEKILVALRSP